MRYQSAGSWRSAVLCAVLVALMSIAACSRGSGPTGTRVMVFGIDGGTWDILDGMMAAGELPAIERLYRNGIHGVLQSRPPALSPVVWSTIFTGRLQDEHGVENWKTSQSTHRKVKALWEITSDLDLTTYVLNVPSSWPPTRIDGLMVSGFPLSGSTVGSGTGEVVTTAPLAEQQGISPIYVLNGDAITAAMKPLEVGGWSDWFAIAVRGRPSWQGRMRVFRFEEDRYYLTPIYRIDDGLVLTHPAELRAELDEHLGDPYIPEGPGWSRHAEEDTPKYLYDHLLQVAEIQSRAAAYLARQRWHVFIYVNTFVDRVSHPYWAYSRPQDYDGLDRAKASRYADRVRRSYIETDKQLAEVLEAAEGEFYVVIASDHGFHSNVNKKQYIGTHDFDGIYLVSGPGLEQSDGGRMFIEDVTPTVLYLLEKPVAEDMKGKVIPAVATAVGRPIEQVPSYEQGTKAASDVPVDGKTWEQLRALGYVDGAPPRKEKPSNR